MMKYICDTAGAMGACAKCQGSKPHECISDYSFVCEDVGHRVRCNPVMDPKLLEEQTEICKVCGAHKANWRKTMGTECHEEHGEGGIEMIQYICDTIEMTQYICDTVEQCGYRVCGARTNHSPHGKCHTEWAFCGFVKQYVRCIPTPNPTHLEEQTTTDYRGIYPTCEANEAVGTECHEEHGTHKCYYCQHEGTDVNRHSSPGDYCCDDGDACDSRWQALEDDEAAKLLEHRVWITCAQELVPYSPMAFQLAESITARIMKLIE